MDKDKAEEEAKEYKDKYDELTTAISNVRTEKTNLLKNANRHLMDCRLRTASLHTKALSGIT